MLCKEQGITVAGVCAAYEIFVTQKVNKRLDYMGKVITMVFTSFPGASSRDKTRHKNSHNGQVFIPLAVVKRGNQEASRAFWHYFMSFTGALTDNGVSAACFYEV